MLVKCPVCQTEYDLEPGKYKCECGAKFVVEGPDATAEVFEPSDDDPNKTIAPRHHADFDPAGDQTMPGKRDRKPDGYFEPGELILNRYKVLGSLGRGGMGVVYKCFDEVGGIEIALKALPPELSHDEEEMEDIKANFQIVSKLVHQNICISKNLEKDSSNGNYYLIMECVEGEDLRRWIRRKRNEGTLTLDEVLPVIRQIAEALDYAHGEGIIHRDIKPGNVMIDQNGRIKILDFGLAAQIHSSMSRVSMAYHGTSGTATYMAPEQWRGQAQRAAADQYALAAMTYEMLAGRLPFEGNDTTLLREAVLNEQPQPIENLPKYVQNALLKALSKKPEDRFANCMGFIEALNSSKKVKKSIPKKTLILILLCISIPVCLGGVGYLGYLGYQEIRFVWEKRLAQKKKAEEEARRAEEKRKADARRAERERLERIAEQRRAEKLKEKARLLAARRAKEKAEAELKKQEQDRILAEKKRQDEIKEADRKAKIDQIYERMEKEITAAFDDAKIQAQANYKKLLDARSSEIESLEKDKNAMIAKFEKNISNLNSQKREAVSIQQLDKLFPLYKPGDYVTVHSNRQGTVSGTLYSIKGRSIFVGGREIDMDGIPQERFFLHVNSRVRNKYISQTTAKYQRQIRSQENQIEKIRQKHQTDIANIERKIENAKNAVSLLDSKKFESLNLLKSNRDEANRSKQWHIEPVNYKKTISFIFADAGFQSSGNSGNSDYESVNTAESEKPADAPAEAAANSDSAGQAPVADQYNFNALIFYAPLEQEESKLPTGQRITTHGNISYTEVDGIKCAHFDGKSMLSFGENKILGNDPCTMSIWVYSTSKVSVKEYETAFAIGRQSRYSKRALIRQDGMFKFDAFNGPIYSRRPLRSQWNFIVAANSGSKVNLYINGQLVGSSLITLQTLQDHISIGAIHEVNGNTIEAWKGYLSHARIYNRCLSQQEISLLATELTPGTIITLPNGINIEMVKIKAGSFIMGSHMGELGHDAIEKQHRVTLTKDFWLGKFEVTQGQWETVMGNNPSRFPKGDNYPVENVSWYDAKKFCDKLNASYSSQLPQGYRFDLPTEAQWEYACRAGTTTALNNGRNLTSNDSYCSNADIVAWYRENSSRTSHEVGRKQPNAWGLYDMHGNVYEWCRDWFGPYSGDSTDPTGPKRGSRRVRRGGAWVDNAGCARSALRFFWAPGLRESFLGFRLALVPVQ